MSSAGAGRARPAQASTKSWGATNRALAHSTWLARSARSTPASAGGAADNGPEIRDLRSSRTGAVVPRSAQYRRSWAAATEWNVPATTRSRKPRLLRRSVSSPAALRVKVRAKHVAGLGRAGDHPVGDTPGQDPCLAGAGSGQHADSRTFRHHRLTLRAVNPSSRLGARRGAGWVVDALTPLERYGGGVTGWWMLVAFGRPPRPGCSRRATAARWTSQMTLLARRCDSPPPRSAVDLRACALGSGASSWRDAWSGTDHRPSGQPIHGASQQTSRGVHECQPGRGMPSPHGSARVPLIPPNMPLSTFAGGRLVGVRHGTDRPWMLALHGWRRDHHDFDEVLAGLDAIALDLPGFGAAAAPPEGWDTADYAEWILPVLDEMAPDPVRARPLLRGAGRRAAGGAGPIPGGGPGAHRGASGAPAGRAGCAVLPRAVSDWA